MRQAVVQISSKVTKAKVPKTLAEMSRAWKKKLRLTHDTHTLCSEERRKPVFGEFAKESLNNNSVTEFYVVSHLWIATNCVQDLF